MKKLISILSVVILSIFCCTGCNSKKSTIVVGYTLYEPMNYLDENGALIGFDTELAKAVFENLGYKVTFQEIDWNSRYSLLDSQAIDCIWNGFSSNITDDDGVFRSEKVDFSHKYMKSRQVIVTKLDSGITSAKDLNNKVAAVSNGSAGDAYAKSFEGVTTKGFIYQADCLVAVNTHAADFAVLDAPIAKKYIGQGAFSDLTIVDDLSSSVHYYAVGFKKGSHLTAKVNDQLEKLANDGTITTLAKRYDVEASVITDFSAQSN